MRTIAAIALILISGTIRAAEPWPVADLLKKEIIGKDQALKDVQAYVDARIPRLKPAASADEWTKEAERIRKEVLEKVVFRGEAAAWRDAKTKVEYFDTIDGGEGYRIKKVRYEILPGFWIPALLYEPTKFDGKVPVSLAVNGHDGKGKAADYKQTRCINMAKRGMIVLNVEWLGMGQLRSPGFRHGCMNQLNLCGSSGLAPFYLSMSRGLDLLLAHPNADPKRVAVSGLSGGGWQTIFISALDTRVTLSNPVAGYSSFRTRVRHFKDLGDSEQTPCDLATIADYTHLTALMAPRPTLLTYNSKDNCCFEAGYALPPLFDGAQPFFKLYGKENALRKHINDDPGTHNFLKDNRQALYRMLGDFFFEGQKGYSADEIECAKEIKTAEQLDVELPADNLDFNKLAKTLAAKLPREVERPATQGRLLQWQPDRRKSLAEILRTNPKPGPQEIGPVASGSNDSATQMKLRTAEGFTLPVVHLWKGEQPRGPLTVLVCDGGRAAAAAEAQKLLDAGRVVLMADLFYHGEAKPQPKDWLWALTLDTVGRRPLGLQVDQLNGLLGAAWPLNQGKPPVLRAVGPRKGTVALLAAGLHPQGVEELELVDPLGSFKQVIDENRTVDQSPELLCFGLLERFDITDIAALVAPRPIKVEKASERAAKEFNGLKDWYTKVGGTLEVSAAR